MSRYNISTSKGFHAFDGVYEINATVSDLEMNKNVVVGKMPNGATLDDIIGVHFEAYHAQVQSIGGTVNGGNNKFFVCNGIAPSLDNSMMYLESVTVRLMLDGDDIKFAIVEGHCYTNKGSVSMVYENATLLFDGLARDIKIYIK